MDLGLKWKTALVTGGSEGIGKAIAETLAGEGVDVAICAWHQGPLEDVAAATVAAVKRDEANGRAFNLVDCYARWADWAKIAAEVLGVHADIDFSSPDAPQNQFDVTAARSLGVGLNRGVEGIRDHLEELAGKMGLSGGC